MYRVVIALSTGEKFESIIRTRFASYFQKKMENSTNSVRVILLLLFVLYNNYNAASRGQIFVIRVRSSSKVNNLRRIFRRGPTNNVLTKWYIIIFEYFIVWFAAIKKMNKTLLARVFAERGQKFYSGIKN